VLAQRQRKLLIFSHAQLIDGQGNVQVPADSVADRLLPRAALAALDQQHFDLLFLDLKLADGPPDDVHDLAKKIDPELPIIIITGYPDSEMLDRILEKGPITVLKSRCKWTSCARPCGFSATKKSRKRRNSITVLLRSHGNTADRLAFFADDQACQANGRSQ
jgi:DNA-binding NtrC family response regulator